MRCLKNRLRWMERLMDIRARASSKSRVAETPIEPRRRIYPRPRFPQRQPDLLLPLCEPPEANTGIPPAPTEKSLRATACEDGLAGIKWPIPDVANDAQCVPEKQAAHSRHTKFLKYSRS